MASEWNFLSGMENDHRVLHELASRVPAGQGQVAGRAQAPSLCIPQPMTSSLLRLDFYSCTPCMKNEYKSFSLHNMRGKQAVVTPGSVNPSGCELCALTPLLMFIMAFSTRVKDQK